MRHAEKDIYGFDESRHVEEERYWSDWCNYGQGDVRSSHVIRKFEPVRREKT